MAHFDPIPGPWEKITKSVLVLLSGLTNGTCVPDFKRFGRKLREEISFEELAHFCSFLGPWTKIAKSGLVLLSELTQGTYVTNFKRGRR